MKKGFYIVIEGQDGTGKTTQVKKLAEYFRVKGRETIIINEGARRDSGLASTDDIGQIIKDRGYDFDELANVLLFTAQRRELWAKVIEPALERDAVVISSRNFWTTLAFQGYASGVDLSLIEKITSDFLPPRYLEPDFGVILTLSDNERKKRQQARDQHTAHDMFEQKATPWQARANRGYAEIAKARQIPLIDASGTIDQIHENILGKL
jgi:dTMP kinase